MVMKKYLVVDIKDANDFFMIDDLNALISELYERELEDNTFDVVKGWFKKNYKIFVSESNIEEEAN
jgi:hypothetical protein